MFSIWICINTSELIPAEGENPCSVLSFPLWTLEMRALLLPVFLLPLKNKPKLGTKTQWPKPGGNVLRWEKVKTSQRVQSSTIRSFPRCPPCDRRQRGPLWGWNHADLFLQTLSVPDWADVLSVLYPLLRVIHLLGSWTKVKGMVSATEIYNILMRRQTSNISGIKWYEYILWE